MKGHKSDRSSAPDSLPLSTTLLKDGVMVVVVAVAIGIAISTAPESDAREPDAIAYALGALIAALLFLRRRWPVAVLVGSAVIFVVYSNLDYPGFVPAIPLAAALYFASAARGPGWPIGVAAVWVVGPLLYRVFVGPEPVLRVLNDSVRDTVFFGAIILLGVAVRSRRMHAAEVTERLRRAEAERERVSRELKLARLVQEQFLPAELPKLPGWKVETFYRSAREVGGDFYDIAELPDGKVGITIGDVTDKGAPAALVMATTQGLLRAEAPRLGSPSAVLELVNEVLVSNTPDRMFATCLYISLDPTSGSLRFANAGHNLPYLVTADGVVELRATGMPLGLMPGTSYELKEATVGAGSRVLLHTDGLAEAHNPDGEMFGFPRLMKVIESCDKDESLIDAALTELGRFTGSEWEQEDDTSPSCR